MRVAQYIRVSTTEQNSALQRADLEKYIQDRGWQCAGIYEDVMSGARQSRPGLNRLLADAAAGNFEAVLVWKLDRFGRSLVDCLNNIRTLETHQVRFISVTQNLDTSHSDPAGRFLLHILGAAAEFERSLIRDRVAAGIQQARKAGKRLGRPKSVFSRTEVRRLRFEEGLSIREICARMDLSIGTVTRALQQAA
jgi:DNA invertase Pin-like site-specific DNA recombinase